MRHSTPFPAGVVIAIALVVLASCSGSAGTADIAGGAPVDTSILPTPGIDGTDPPDPNNQPVDLHSIPVPAAAVASSPATVNGSTTVQSYDVDGMSVTDLATYFDQALPSAGWSTGGAPSGDGGADWTGTWAKDGATLTISASPTQLGSGPGSEFDVSVDSP